MRKLIFALVLVAALAATAKNKTSYVYSHGDGNTIQSSGSLDSILRIAKKWDGEFLWMRREDGREYLIRDAATLADLRAAFREVNALHPKHEEIARRLRPLEEREEEIEEQIDAISDGDEPDGGKLRELEKKMRAIEEKLRVVEREMEDLEKKMDALEEIAEKRLYEIVGRAIRNGVAQRVD